MITKIKPTADEIQRSFMFLDIASGKSQNEPNSNSQLPPSRFKYVLYERYKRELDKRNLTPDEYERERKLIIERLKI